MLEYNHVVKKRVTALTRLLAVLLGALCVLLLMSQTVFATNFYLINDGDTFLIYASQATDPVAVLEEAGRELDTTDLYTTRSGFAISEIIVQRSQKIALRCGNTTIQMHSYGETVRELLDRAGITLTDQDQVSVPLDAATYDGLVIDLTQVQTVQETYQEEISFETSYVYDASLKKGEQKVITPGVAGQVRITTMHTYVNGVKTGSAVVDERVLEPAVNAVIAVGDKEPAPEITVTEELSQAIAQAKETGIPVIEGGLIITPEGELLTYASEGIFKATAYHNSDPGCTIWTATGTLCRVGAIAVDPKVIPYGTKMYIVSNDGKFIYGYAVAEDCGGSIKGNRIDLYYDSTAECSAFGIRDCTVYFLTD